MSPAPLLVLAGVAAALHVGKLAPAVAWLAARSGTWQLTWVFTGLCCLAGAVLTAPLARRLRAKS